MRSFFKYTIITLLLCFTVAKSFAMPENTTHTTPNLHSGNTEFWQQGTFSSFLGIDSIRINFAAFTQPSYTQCLVLSPGRSESYIKYQELAFELSQQGYNIFIIDHRGQGLSQRMTTNPHKGYVKQFDDYAHDLATFINQYVLPHCAENDKPLLLAHSMGGAIATRTMQLYPELIKAAVLSSPMFAINSGAIPLWLAKGLIGSGTYLNQLLSEEPWYFIGQGNYQHSAFEDNPLTHSKSRYQQFISRYQAQSTVQLGGVTYHWLAQSLQVKDDIFADIERMNTPILILQAGADSIVDNNAQNDFCAALQQHKKLCSTGSPIRINGAYHELFFEKDVYRQQAITTALSWLQKFE